MVAQNRKARHDYHLHDRFEAGMVLTGTEVKSLRAGRASLADAFATVDDGEVWLRNAHIPEYAFGTWTNHATRRNRKLLLHRKEIDKLDRETDVLGQDHRAAGDLLLRRLRQGRTGDRHRQEGLGQAPDHRRPGRRSRGRRELAQRNRGA